MCRNLGCRGGGGAVTNYLELVDGINLEHVRSVPGVILRMTRDWPELGSLTWGTILPPVSEPRPSQASKATDMSMWKGEESGQEKQFESMWEAASAGLHTRHAHLSAMVAVANRDLSDDLAAADDARRARAGTMVKAYGLAASRASVLLKNWLVNMGTCAASEIDEQLSTGLADVKADKVLEMAGRSPVPLGELEAIAKSGAARVFFKAFQDFSCGLEVYHELCMKYGYAKAAENIATTSTKKAYSVVGIFSLTQALRRRLLGKEARGTVVKAARKEVLENGAEIPTPLMLMVDASARNEGSEPAVASSEGSAADFDAEDDSALGN